MTFLVPQRSRLLSGKLKTSAFRVETANVFVGLPPRCIPFLCFLFVAWPATAVVARAYLDQLTRSKVIEPERARAVRTALDRADDARSSRGKSQAAIDQLDGLTAQLDRDAAAAAAVGRDAARLRSLAATLKGVAAKLH